MGICAPFVLSGNLSFGQEPNTTVTNPAKRKKVSFGSSQPVVDNKPKIHAEATNLRQKIYCLVNPPPFQKGGTQEEITNFISTYSDNPTKQAAIITSLIDNSTINFITNKTGIKGSIYGITKDNYKAVEKKIKEKMGMSLEELITTEMGKESADLLRHINQFKQN